MGATSPGFTSITPILDVENAAGYLAHALEELEHRVRRRAFDSRMGLLRGSSGRNSQIAGRTRHGCRGLVNV